MSSRYLEGPTPRIFAHRGLATHAPENTVAAFRAALDAGAHYLETDAHTTADGVAVLAHDPEIVDRGRLVAIRTTTWSELESVDLGGGAGVPRLDEALRSFPQARFNIDVKSRDAVEAVARAIDTESARDRVLVTSFDGATRRDLVASLHAVVTSASSDLIARAVLPSHLGDGRRLGRILSGVACVQIPERHRGLPLVTRRTVGTFHDAGVEVHVWTVNDPADMRRLVALGVDGVVTDRCDIARDALARLRPRN